MSEMEQDVKDFLQRIVWSISLGLLWLLINMTAGIFGGWLFFEGRPSIGNIIFYVWLLISMAFLLRFYYRTWSKRFPHG